MSELRLMSLDKTRNDFDRIARLVAEAPERPGPYDAFLLGQLPAPPARLLEVGCGTGALSRAAAAAGYTVTGIDLSPEMIRVARRRTAESSPVTFLCGDFLSLALAGEGFDCVMSMATLHHLPLEEAVTRMVRLTRPGGLLVIHDLRSDEGIWDRMRSLGGVAARVWTRLRAAWREHGHAERYPTLKEVEAWSRKHLPGARAHRHLQWRYTVVWRKPGPP